MKRLLIGESLAVSLEPHLSLVALPLQLVRTAAPSCSNIAFCWFAASCGCKLCVRNCWVIVKVLVHLRINLQVVLMLGLVIRLVELLDGHLVLRHQGLRVLLHLLDCPRIGQAGGLGGAGASGIGRF